MGVTTYFFDTYALLEVVLGSNSYQSFTQVGIITTKMNLFELHYALFLKFGRAFADKIYDRFLPYAADFSDETIKKASIFRASLKSRKLSYVDCLGYIIALASNIKFLTGDRQFRDLPCVAYVK